MSKSCLILLFLEIVIIDVVAASIFTLNTVEL